MSTLSAAVATALDQVQAGDYDLNVSALQHVLNAIYPVLDLREAEARERYRFGWCCDFDFDHGTYRTTDCISRTRDADAVERAVRAEWAQERAALVAAVVALADAAIWAHMQSTNLGALIRTETLRGSPMALTVMLGDALREHANTIAAAHLIAGEGI